MVKSLLVTSLSVVRCVRQLAQAYTFLDSTQQHKKQGAWGSHLDTAEILVEARRELHAFSSQVTPRHRSEGVGPKQSAPRADLGKSRSLVEVQSRQSGQNTATCWFDSYDMAFKPHTGSRSRNLPSKHLVNRGAERRGCSLRKAALLFILVRKATKLNTSYGS